jgi:hypothetical protein
MVKELHGGGLGISQGICLWTARYTLLLTRLRTRYLTNTNLVFFPIFFCVYWSGTETSCWMVAAAFTVSTNCQLKPILKDCRFDQHRQWMLTSESVWGRMHKQGTNWVHWWILSETCMFICKCRVVMRCPEEIVDVASLSMQFCTFSGVGVPS